MNRNYIISLDSKNIIKDFIINNVEKKILVNYIILNNKNLYSEWNKINKKN